MALVHVYNLLSALNEQQTIFLCSSLLSLRFEKCVYALVASLAIIKTKIIIYSYFNNQAKIFIFIYFLKILILQNVTYDSEIPIRNTGRTLYFLYPIGSGTPCTVYIQCMQYEVEHPYSIHTMYPIGSGTPCTVYILCIQYEVEHPGQCTYNVSNMKWNTLYSVHTMYPIGRGTSLYSVHTIYTVNTGRTLYFLYPIQS